MTDLGHNSVRNRFAPINSKNLSAERAIFRLEDWLDAERAFFDNVGATRPGRAGILVLANVHVI
jgi:hypothetical protein